MTVKDIALYYKAKQAGQDADTYKQQADTYESVLTGEVTEFVIPDGWTMIRQGAFRGCSKLVSVTIPDGVTIIRDSAFSDCTSLSSIIIPNSVNRLVTYAFQGCTSLASLTIPQSITRIDDYVFKGCSSLVNVTIGNGFNCKNLDLSASTKYSVDTLVTMLTALADRTGQEAYTLTLGSTNLAKLSDEQKAIATDKNWTLA